MDRLVAFFRALTSEQSLDDLQPGLRIVYARGSAGAREAVVLLPVSAPSVAEVVARAARLAGGQCFTGGGRHFVPWRDASAPLGYDAAAVSQEVGDFVLYGAEHDVAYRIESELPLARLLVRLSLQRRVGESFPTEGPLLLMARRGLGPLVAEYLHRARVAATRGGPRGGEPGLHAAGALCETIAGGAFSAPRTFWLFRLESSPPRLRGLLTKTPGLELYAPVTDNVAVAVGFRHPVALESCRSSFPADRLTLFSPRALGVLEIAPLPVFTPVEDIVRIRPPAAREAERAVAHAQGRPDVTVPLRLEPRGGACCAPRGRLGALGPRAVAAAPLLRAADAGPRRLPRGGARAGRARPRGRRARGAPLRRAADRRRARCAPLGTRVRPAVAPELLAERLGAERGALVVFPALGAPPFRVSADAVEPLDRRALSDMRRPDDEPNARGAAVATAEPDAPIEIENEPLGPMPLWGLED